MRRPKMHAFPSYLEKDRTYKGNWIRELKRSGFDVEVRILEEVSKEKLSEAEVRWIAKGRQEGWPLTNLTEGGEGGHSGRTFTPEHRAKISAANKGRKMTQEQRQRCSEAAKRRPYDPLRVVAMQRAWKGSKHTVETRARIGIGNRRPKPRIK